MPFNLLKQYNELLDFGALTSIQRVASLRCVFNRDIANNSNLRFKSKLLFPIKKEGEEPVEILFNHLTTHVVDQGTRRREFDNLRAIRLHWFKFHVNENKSNDVLHFSVEEGRGSIRTYIYDIKEKYVIILEPYRNKQAYYIITAYYLTQKDEKRDKILKKYERKLTELH